MKLTSILIALDSSQESKAGLRAAAEMAGQTGASIKTLFIEDQNWFDASRTSIVQHVSRYSGEPKRVDEEEISMQSRALQHRLENSVTRISKEWKIKYSYESVRGEVNKELINAAEEAEIVIVGRRGRSFRGRHETGSTALYLANKCTSPVLIWSDSYNWPSILFGLSSDPENSDRMLQWLTYLGTSLQRGLRLVWIGNYDKSHIRNKLAGFDNDIPREIISKISMQTMEQAGDLFQLSGRGLVIAQRDDAMLKEMGIHTFLSNLHNPVLLI